MERKARRTRWSSQLWFLGSGVESDGRRPCWERSRRAGTRVGAVQTTVGSVFSRSRSLSRMAGAVGHHVLRWSELVGLKVGPGRRNKSGVREVGSRLGVIDFEQFSGFKSLSSLC
jgi:hypothetical protein